MNVDFKGYNENVATFMVDETVTAGTLVKMSSNFTMTACENGDDIMGVCLNARDGYGAIQLSGYVELPTTDGFMPGYNQLCAKDSKTVCNGSATMSNLVIYSDTNVVGFIL